MVRFRKALHRFHRVLHIVILVGGLLLTSATIARISIALSSSVGSPQQTEATSAIESDQSQEESVSPAPMATDFGIDIPTAISLRQGAVRARYPVASGIVGLILAGLALSGLTAAVLSRRDEKSGS